MVNEWIVVLAHHCPQARNSGQHLIGYSWSRKSSSTESAVSALDCVTYDGLAESIHQMQICPYMTQENYIPISHFASDLEYELMVRILSRTSEELRLLEHMNQPSYRADPWNPAPYLLWTFDRDETDVYACFEELTPYDQPPFLTVAHYLDFFGQLLQGLTFLHELSIVNLNCAKRSSFMIDLSAGSATSSAEIPCSLVTSASRIPDPYHGSTEAVQLANKLLAAQDTYTIPSRRLFDRAKFPVKYYIVDYSDAIQLSYHSSSSCGPDQHFSAPTTTTSSPYARDIRDLGSFFSHVLDDVPELDSNFRPFVSAMITGELSADGTRTLFEALCHTLESSVFDVSVQIPRPPALYMHTRLSSPSSMSENDV